MYVENQAAPVDPPRTAARRAPRVLVTGPLPWVRRNLSLGLSAAGVETADAGDPALLSATEAAEDSDAVLCDGRIDPAGALAYLRKLRVRHRSLPVVLIAQPLDEVLVAEANAIGVHVLYPPVDATVLRRVLAALFP